LGPLYPPKQTIHVNFGHIVGVVTYHISLREIRSECRQILVILLVLSSYLSMLPRLKFAEQKVELGKSSNRIDLKTFPMNPFQAWGGVRLRDLLQRHLTELLHSFSTVQHQSDRLPRNPLPRGDMPASASTLHPTSKNEYPYTFSTALSKKATESNRDTPLSISIGESARGSSWRMESAMLGSEEIIASTRCEFVDGVDV
jgi:hypothetical protein